MLNLQEQKVGNNFLQRMRSSGTLNLVHPLFPQTFEIIAPIFAEEQG